MTRCLIGAQIAGLLLAFIELPVCLQHRAPRFFGLTIDCCGEGTQFVAQPMHLIEKRQDHRNRVRRHRHLLFQVANEADAGEVQVVEKRSIVASGRADPAIAYPLLNSRS